jgi:APA family basic amino acid/polyamine antiporter
VTVPASRPSGPALLRSVSRWEIVGLCINDVVGSGVYLLPAAAAALLGAASTLAILLAGLAVGLLVLCFAEASSHFDEPGGGYLYTREAFGPFVGFEVGWMTWLARIASVASLSNGFVLATAFLWPAAATGWPRALLITAALATLAWINVIGVKTGARANVALAVAKIAPLGVFIVVGLLFTDWSRVVAIESPPATALGEASLLLLFAFAGFENTPAAAGEYRDPRRNVPFALPLAMLIITITYFLVQVVSLGTLPELANAGSPLAEAATRFIGGWGGMLMTVGAMVSIFGNVGGTTLIGPRYLYALAKDGYGPSVLSRIHPKYHTPAAAIVTQTALALGLALSGSFVQLAMLSIVARLATYMGTAAAVPFLRRRFRDRQRDFRLPGGILIPAAALLLALAFLSSTTPANLLAGGIGLVVGAVIYRFRRTPEEARIEV